MSVVKTRWADAATTDGRNWDLYIDGKRFYDDQDTLNASDVMVPDVKYGTWSEKTGLKRSPVRLPTEYKLIQQEGDQLLQLVKENIHHLPFKLTDTAELWLVDRDNGLPLVLIDSAREGSKLTFPTRLHWNPGQLCRQCFGSKYNSRALEHGYQHSADLLAKMINQQTGPKPKAEWYLRQADGTGIQIDQETGKVAFDGKTLSVNHFPGYLIRQNWEDELTKRLVEEYISWQAPCLLLLQDISKLERQRLELEACTRATELARQLVMYPEIVQGDAVTAALVEARLREVNSVSITTQDNDRTLSPEYIETQMDDS